MMALRTADKGFASAQQILETNYTMALEIGTKAPEFSLATKTADGPEKIRLSDNFGSRNTVLLFFPLAFSSICTEEMCDVSSGLGEYSDLNAAVYGISGDSPHALEAWAREKNITVTLLGDYDHKVTEAYGVAYDSFIPEMGLVGVAKRSAFVIDKTGVIQYAESSDNPKQLPDFEAIKAKLAELQ